MKFYKLQSHILKDGLSADEYCKQNNINPYCVVVMWHEELDNEVSQDIQEKLLTSELVVAKDNIYGKPSKRGRKKKKL